jgi:biopolymer transport protein ExbD
MAFATGPSGNGGGGRRRRGLSVGTMAEINVVPLVDVVLVLLIIFMLTAHAMEFGLEIEAPVVKDVQDTAQDLPVVSITRDGKMYVNEAPVNNLNQIGDQIKQRFGETAVNQGVYVKGDRRLQLEEFLQVIDVLHQAHFTKISVVAKPQDVTKP